MAAMREYHRWMLGWRIYSIFIIAATLFAQPRERYFHFEYRATVPAATSGNDFRVWIPIPHDDEYQRITNLKIDSSAPYKVATDPLGNRIVGIESSTPPSITVKFDCVRTEHLRPADSATGAASLNDAERVRWLQP